VNRPADSSGGIKQLRLRYAGCCRACGTKLAAGTQAIYHRAIKQIECLTCAAAYTTTAEPITPVPESATEPPEAGVAGASARREHERRVHRREQRVRQAHPRLGGLILALTDEPQSTRAWSRGANGEERIGQMLDKLADRGVRVLHDRRIPGTRANIDHIAIGSAGVFVVDTKRYKGRPHLRVEGGLLRPRVEKLMVGSRDCTKLVSGVTKQVDLVRVAIGVLDANSPIAVRGMMCFIDADWPLIGGTFTIGGISVVWPKRAADHICEGAALTDEAVAETHRKLAAAFPVHAAGTQS
jgi:hypothetical protein